MTAGWEWILPPTWSSGMWFLRSTRKDNLGCHEAYSTHLSPETSVEAGYLVLAMATQSSVETTSTAVTLACGSVLPRWNLISSLVKRTRTEL